MRMRGEVGRFVGCWWCPNRALDLSILWPVWSGPILLLCVCHKDNVLSQKWKWDMELLVVGPEKNNCGTASPFSCLFRCLSHRLFTLKAFLLHNLSMKILGWDLGSDGICAEEEEEEQQQQQHCGCSKFCFILQTCYTYKRLQKSCSCVVCVHRSVSSKFRSQILL
jgi:hypothetical protein